MKLGLALSGGGVKGAAHIGVIKALEEENIKIDVIAGTSSGSIVSALYAMGYKEDEMLKLFNEFSKVLTETSTRYFINHIAQTRNFLPEGTRSGENIEYAMQEIAEYKNIEKISDIQMPISIPTVDLISGKEYVFTNNKKQEDYYIKDANIAKAIRASCSFPGVYAPCPYENYSFSDGGILDNIPVEETKKLGADKVIAVSFGVDGMPRKSNMYTIILRSIEIMSQNMVRNCLNKSDYTLNIHLGTMRLLDSSKIEKCYNMGYETAKEHMNEIKSIIASKP